MNHNLFKEHTNMLIEILSESNILNKERQHREKELLSIYYEMKKKNKINNKYYNISHEIRSLEFLNKYGNLKIANDSKSEKGCDFELNKQLQIECVCSSSGNEKLNGLEKFHGSGEFDYGRKETIILTRLTQSIKEKKAFYNEHIKDETIDKNKPYIIFLSLGNLTYGSFSGVFGFVLNKILFGVGHHKLVIDRKTNKVIETGYTHNSIIKKHNNSDIDCNIFANQENNCISAILFSIATLDEHYTPKNTFLFVNPNSINKIKVKDFKNIVYWRKNNKNFYIPRIRGINLNDKLKKKYF